MEWRANPCAECGRVLFFTDDTDLILCGYGCYETFPVLWEDPDDEDNYDPQPSDDD